MHDSSQIDYFAAIRGFRDNAAIRGFDNAATRGLDKAATRGLDNPRRYQRRF